MAYDEDLANRLRELLAGEDGVTEKRMFGGLAFMVAGNLTVAASGQGGLLARLGHEAAERATSKPHVEPMSMRGRPMRGWVRVAPGGLGRRRELQDWVGQAVAFVRTLPEKG